MKKLLLLFLFIPFVYSYEVDIDTKINWTVYTDNSCNLSIQSEEGTRSFAYTGYEDDEWTIDFTEDVGEEDYANESWRCRNMFETCDSLVGKLSSTLDYLPKYDVCQETKFTCLGAKESVEKERDDTIRDKDIYKQDYEQCENERTRLDNENQDMKISMVNKNDCKEDRDNAVKSAKNSFYLIAGVLGVVGFLGGNMYKGKKDKSKEEDEEFIYGE